MPSSSSASTGGPGERVVIVDVETTGLSVRGGGRVIEVGAVALCGGRIVGEFSSLIDAGAPISWGARQVHGISDAMLCGQPAPDQVWPEFVAFVEGAQLVAHNAPFDRAFIEFETLLAGHRLENSWGCTLRLARRCLPKLDNHRLATVAHHLLGAWPWQERAHRALGDARVTAQVWLELNRL